MNNTKSKVSIQSSRQRVSRLFCIFCIFIASALLLTSCGSPPPIEEISERLIYLIENSYEINEIFFGSGLETIDADALGEPVYGYEYVIEDAKYTSVDMLKEAAEKIFSETYLEGLYETLFDGYADESVGIVSARFIEEEGYLLQEANIEPLYKGIRKYDYDTMKIVRPSSNDYINVEIVCWVEGGEELQTSDAFSEEMNDILSGKRVTTTLSFILTDGEWYLDSPTY